MQQETTRRALFGFVGLAAAAVAMPAVVVGAMRHTPTDFAILHAVYDAAKARFRALPDDLEHTDPARFEREELLIGAAGDAFDRAVPTNMAELVIAMENLFGDGGYPDAELSRKLIEHARDIAKREAR
jgi:hypothetical protein